MIWRVHFRSPQIAYEWQRLRRVEKQFAFADIDSVIDDILVTYLLAMVDPEMMDSDDFDVDGLREMLAAYIPEVDQISE